MRPMTGPAFWSKGIAAISPEYAQTQKEMGFDPETDDPRDPREMDRMFKPVQQYSGWGGLQSIGEGIHNAGVWQMKNQALNEQRASQRAASQAMERFATGATGVTGPAAFGDLMRNPQTRQMGMNLYMDQQRERRARDQDERNFAQQKELKRDDWSRQDADPLRQAQIETARAKLDPLHDDRQRVAQLGAWGIDPNSDQGRRYRQTGSISDEGKIGTLKQDEVLYVPDKREPNGVRFVAPPGGGDSGREFGKKAGGVLADSYGEYLKDGQSKAALGADLAEIRRLSGAIGDPGKWGQWKLAAGPYLKSIGISVDGLNELQAFQAIVNRVAPNMRPVGSGTTTDFEFKKYMESLPGLLNSPDGRAMIMKQFESMAEFSQRREQIASLALTKRMSPAQAQDEIAALTEQFRSGLGLGPMRVEGPTTASGPTMDRSRVMKDAQDAIARGADPAKVRERLRANGIEMP